MSSDTSQARSRAEDTAEGTRQAEGTGPFESTGPAEGTGPAEELLIEEISIDGMCGVY